jgi:hypothetical protein
MAQCGVSSLPGKLLPKECDMTSQLFVLFAQRDLQPSISPLFLIVWLALMVAVFAGFWKTFEKAGKPGWGAIIPIYNIVLLLEIADRPLWWLLLFFIPCVNIVVSILVALDIARNFGKEAIFGVGLAFLPFIFYPILGFSDAKYQPVNH